jgi:hypothetical protein
VASRFLASSLVALSALTCTAQVTGKFYLEKSQFSPTEPVFVYFKLTNNGSAPIDISTPDPEQPMCAGVSNRVFRNGVKIPSCFDFAEEVCVINGGGWPSVRVLPGQSHVDRYLLNYGHDFNVLGDYRVESERIGFAGNRLQSVKAMLRFRVDADAAPISSAEIQAWVNQLKSSDLYRRIEAARTLANIAPRSIEQILFAFAGSADFSKYAPLALYRLHTARSMQALADLMRTSSPGSSESMEAASYLAESGDPKWYPLLLEFAQKSPQIGYPTYAAELGGKISIPALVEIASSSVNFDASYGRSNAIMALGSTHSRAAIPVLLEWLQSGDEDASDRAVYSLRLLTHRTSFADPQTRDHNLETVKWSNWWRHEGATAHIFKDTQCADPVPLP